MNAENTALKLIICLQERPSGVTAPPPPNSNIQPVRAGMMNEDTPDYIKQRQGKRGEFRYF